MGESNGLTGVLLNKEIEQYIIALDCIYKPGGVKTISAISYDSAFYTIQTHLRKYHRTTIEHNELVSIIEELGVQVSFLPPIEQRDDDGIDNALDGEK